MLERVALDADALAKALDEVRASDHISEAVIVATCNRLELYADVATFHGGVDEVSALLALHTAMPLDDLTPYLYVHYEDRAVAHLFRVVSGLDAMVVGESQILGQVREAFRAAQTSNVTGRVLTELFQSALRAGKRAHAETGIDLAGRSLVTVGLARVLPSVFSADSEEPWDKLIDGRQVLVVGAGAMAALTASTVARAGARVVVANRTHERGARLAASVGGSALAMHDAGDLVDAIADADVLISCTGASGHVLSVETIRATMERRSAPLAVLDLALPRDVDPEAGGLAGVTLVDLSALAQGDGSAGSHGEAGDVASEVEAVQRIVAEEIEAYGSARRAAEVAPTVVALRSMADEVIAREMSRLSGRLPGIDDRTRSEVVATVRRVVDKLLHSPTVRVKELAAQPDGAAYEAALRELFALDRGAVAAVVNPDSDEGVTGS
jgi:glutamyl-tRNA reductase